jgi:hypothetical protein
MSDLPAVWDMEHELYERACEGADWDYSFIPDDPYAELTEEDP